MAIMQPREAGGGVPQVLLVEGAPSIHRNLGQRLRDQGVVLMAVDSVASALEVLEGLSFGVVIIDQLLPDGSGLDVLDAVRASGSRAHVIIMSSSPDRRARASARERGADDYVLKPCLLRELTSRVLAVARWTEPGAHARLAVGPFMIDLRARQVRGPDGILDLTAKEFDLLAFFAARPGHVFSKAELLRSVWRSAPEWQQTATVTEHIRRLRRKIEVERGNPQILRTVRGSGYRLDLPASDSPRGDLGPRFQPATIIHIAGRIVNADRAAGALLGPTPEAELVGRHIFDLAASTSRQATRERMALTGPVPARRSQLIDLERTEGAAVSVEVTSEQTSWEGRPAGQVTLTHVPDVSARLRRMVTGVLGDITDAVIITDLHFHLRSWNKAAERLYGWREREVLGRHVLDVLGDSGDDDVLAPAWESLEDSGRWKGESCQRTRDGSEIDVLSCITLIRDETGEPILIVAVNRPAPAPPSTQETAALYDDDQIRRGLASDAFGVHYQPIVDLRDERVIAMEALVRWDHPERGLLAPHSFISAAERSGAITELGSVVFEKACTQAAEWRRAGIDLALSVNLSARQLADPALYDRIVTVLAYTGFEPERLWLEVTETSLIEDVDLASAVLNRLADLGVGITIDDFGTGWASLTYLRNFPIQALKIDRSFVAGVDSNANDTAIARSILALGAELGLEVVAEGIETRAQLRALQKLGCTMGQGFLFGQPEADPYPRADEGTRAAASVPAASVPAARVPAGSVPAGGALPTGAGSRPPRARSGKGRRAPVAGRQRSAVPFPNKSRRVTVGLVDIEADVIEADVIESDLIEPDAIGSDVDESDVVAELLRGLLRIGSASAASDLLQRTIRRLGGSPVPAVEAGDHALPVDVSLGEGQPMLVEVELFTVARMQLKRLLPRLVDDARQAVSLLRQTGA